jgi:RNA polymerase sigma-70 factor (ECF subfamily)
MKKGDVPVRPNLRSTPLAATLALRLDATPTRPEPARAPASPPSAANDPSPAHHGSSGKHANTDHGGNGSLEFDRIYIEHFHHVSRWARALGGRSADLDDLTQEVFLVVRRRLSSYEGPSLAAWLYGITRKTVSDYRRRAWIRRLLGGAHQSLDSLPASQHMCGIDAVERLEAQRILQRVLDQMSSVRRTAFVLFEIEGYSGDEIAELEQVPLATVYTRLHHARKDFLRLTAAISGEVPEEPLP